MVRLKSTNAHLWNVKTRIGTGALIEFKNGIAECSLEDAITLVKDTNQAVPLTDEDKDAIEAGHVQLVTLPSGTFDMGVDTHLTIPSLKNVKTNVTPEGLESGDAVPVHFDARGHTIVGAVIAAQLKTIYHIEAIAEPVAPVAEVAPAGAVAPVTAEVAPAVAPEPPAVPPVEVAPIESPSIAAPVVLAPAAPGTGSMTGPVVLLAPVEAAAAVVLEAEPESDAESAETEDDADEEAEAATPDVAGTTPRVKKKPGRPRSK